ADSAGGGAEPGLAAGDLAEPIGPRPGATPRAAGASGAVPLVGPPPGGIRGGGAIGRGVGPAGLGGGPGIGERDGPGRGGDSGEEGDADHALEQAQGGRRGRDAGGG